MYLYLYSLQAGPSKVTSNRDHQHHCDRAESGRAGWRALLGSQRPTRRQARSGPARLSRVTVWRPATMLW